MIEHMSDYFFDYLLDLWREKPSKINGFRHIYTGSNPVCSS